MKRISVIIPAMNGGNILERCLKSLSQQTVFSNMELIVLDSASTDNTVDIAQKYGAKVINVPRGTFNHGLTRNLGVTHASGELIFLTVQDAYLAEPNAIEKMASHFNDKDVVAVGGHQAVAVHKDHNPVQWFKRYTQPTPTERYFPKEGVFDKLSLEERVDNARWDDVIAMYRKDKLLEQPFVETEFAEDCVWAYQALQKGWKLIYDPSVVAYHYHFRDYSYSYKVAYAVNYHFLLFFGYVPPIPFSLKKMILVPYLIVKNKHFSWKEKIYWTYNNYAGMLGDFLSHLDFRINFLLSGLSGVHKRYCKVCKVIPVGKQKNH